MRKPLLATCIIIALVIGARAQTRPGPAPADLYKLQSVGNVQLSPDGTHVAYSITHNERPGRPCSDTWIRELATGRAAKLNGGAGPRWSRDGRWVAYQGRREGHGLRKTKHVVDALERSIAWYTKYFR